MDLIICMLCDRWYQQKDLLPEDERTEDRCKVRDCTITWDLSDNNKKYDDEDVDAIPF